MKLYLVHLRFTGRNRMTGEVNKQHTSIILQLPAHLNDPKITVEKNLRWLYKILDPNINFDVLSVQEFKP